MDSPDQDFYKEYRPLHVPHKYDAAASLQDNVVYALAQLEYATAPQVAQKLWQHDPQTNLATHQKNAEEVLTYLFDKGLIKGDDEIERQYDLSKILVQNSGKADPLY
ncbi:hypothetical protein [Mucilaginibacter psychrotolerans]|uniref:Uncharacterized protein n=1 Tax=Mucilaginibacter psychrotolerans TaxID=1524096 RepID=A0A4Y8RXR9_9SPHI|nr:hypothetical protein [Mucilaginibacter psychrotolerans]TFF30423.1 hypothetical protein E2R66_27240 [Mucilaginibacter psychrotolerans]